MNVSIRFAALAVAASIVTGSAAKAELIYAISAGNELTSFDSATPSVLGPVIPITGITAGAPLRGIDFRASNGLLYGLGTVGTAAQLYTIDLATGVASTVGGAITLTGNTSTRVSLDFNPVPNALRVVTGSGQSYRVNANTGTLIAQDTSIVSSVDGSTPLIAGVAYSNNVAGATSTTLYAYDFVTDTVGTIGGVNSVPSPNGGIYTPIGSTNPPFSAFDGGVGMDISGATGIAYLSGDEFSSPTAADEFYTIDLATGAATFIGEIPGNLLDISVLPVAIPEPTTLGLVAIAGLGLLGRRRRA